MTTLPTSTHGPHYMYPTALAEFERLQRTGLHPNLPRYQAGAWYITTPSASAPERPGAPSPNHPLT